MLPRKPFPGGVEGREVVSQEGLHQGGDRLTAPACLLSASIKPGLGEAPKAMRAWDPLRRAARVASQTGPFHPARRSTLRAPRKGTLLVSERARRPSCGSRQCRLKRPHRFRVGCRSAFARRSLALAMIAIGTRSRRDYGGSRALQGWQGFSAWSRQACMVQRPEMPGEPRGSARLFPYPAAINRPQSRGEESIPPRDALCLRASEPWRVVITNANARSSIDAERGSPPRLGVTTCGRPVSFQKIAKAPRYFGR